MSSQEKFLASFLCSWSFLPSVLLQWNSQPKYSEMFFLFEILGIASPFSLPNVWLPVTEGIIQTASIESITVSWEIDGFFGLKIKCNQLIPCPLCLHRFYEFTQHSPKVGNEKLHSHFLHFCQQFLWKLL